MSQKFWGVWIEDGGRPNQPYATLEAAKARAEQLARTTRSRVFVLEALLVAVPELQPVEEIGVAWESTEPGEKK